MCGAAACDTLPASPASTSSKVPEDGDMYLRDRLRMQLVPYPPEPAFLSCSCESTFMQGSIGYAVWVILPTCSNGRNTCTSRGPPKKKGKPGHTQGTQAGGPTTHPGQQIPRTVQSPADLHDLDRPVRVCPRSVRVTGTDGLKQ